MEKQALKHEIVLVINGLRHLMDKKFADELFDLLESEREWLPLKRIGWGFKVAYSRENLRACWDSATRECEKNTGIANGGNVEFSAQRNYYGSVAWHPDGTSQIVLYIPISAFIKIESSVYLNFAKKLFIWCDGSYGYSCHSSQRKVHSMPGVDYRTCLGGVSWMTILGRPYVDFLGAELIRNTPCRVEEVTKQGFILLSSDLPQIPTLEILECQSAIKKHLGEDMFFRREEEEQQPKHYTLDELRAGKDQPNIERYRHPDFTKYMKQDIGNDIRLIFNAGAF